MSILRFGDTFFALRFLRLLTTPWKKTNAYKKGLIDERGNKIKDPKTPDEKSVYNLFHKLVFNIKRLLNKLPLGKTTLASYAAALYLIKEQSGLSEEIISEILEEVSGYSISEEALDLDETVEVLSGDCNVSGHVYNLTQNEICEYPNICVTDIKSLSNIYGQAIYEATDKDSGDILVITKAQIVR